MTEQSCLSSMLESLKGVELCFIIQFLLSDRLFIRLLGSIFLMNKILSSDGCVGVSCRALLYGGMKESQPQAEVCLEETRAEAFSMLLGYIYTGRVSLSAAREEVLLDFLGLAHRYGLQLLEDSTSEFLRTILNTHNVCLVFDVATLYSLSTLSAACCAYMDRHAPEVLTSDGFLTLSKVEMGLTVSAKVNYE